MTWHGEDPPDAKETRRTKLIAKVQGTENPFVIMPHLVKKIVPQLIAEFAVESGDAANDQGNTNVEKIEGLA